MFFLSNLIIYPALTRTNINNRSNLAFADLVSYVFGSHDINSNIAFAQQQNNTNLTSTTAPITASGVFPINSTIIGNTITPPLTADVKPTLVPKNVTAAAPLLTENTTAPVSPTGISTNTAHVPRSIGGNSSLAQNTTAPVSTSNMMGNTPPTASYSSLSPATTLSPPPPPPLPLTPHQDKGKHNKF
jgi:hypothetical protein